MLIYIYIFLNITWSVHIMLFLGLFGTRQLIGVLFPNKSHLPMPSCPQSPIVLWRVEALCDGVCPGWHLLCCRPFYLTFGLSCWWGFMGVAFDGESKLLDSLAPAIFPLPLRQCSQSLRSRSVLLIYPLGLCYTILHFYQLGFPLGVSVAKPVWWGAKTTLICRYKGKCLQIVVRMTV